MSEHKVYGIDLGTTYSCIAHVDEYGKPVIVNNSENESTTPSVVYFESESNIVVGSDAKEQALIEPDLVVETIKRAMGEPGWERQFHGKTYSPSSISALILKKLVEDARTVTGDTIEDVVITCPAYFGFNEKEATRQAGEIAGLNVKYVIPEPTAAALAYGSDQGNEDQTVLVYDLGGGTFDVTVIDIQGGNLTVVCTGGDHKLGGKDWDDAIVSHLAYGFEDETGIAADELLEDRETYAELVKEAEDLKKSLSNRESKTTKINHAGESAKITLTREEFDRSTADKLGRTIELTKEVIAKAAAKGRDRIDKILLVGGSTYMPQVRGAVEEAFSLPVEQFDPNQAVAKGAAVFGYKCAIEDEIRIALEEELGEAAPESLEEVAPEKLERAISLVADRRGVDRDTIEEETTRKVVNVTSKSFGMISLNGDDREVVSQLVLVDEEVPTKRTETFYTVADGQEMVSVRCRESTLSEKVVEVGDSKEVGEADLKFKKPVAKGSPLEMTFKLRPDGLLEVHGVDLTTGGELHVEFRTESILSREEVDEAKEQVSALRIG